MVELSFFNLIREKSLLKTDQAEEIKIIVSGHAGFDKRSKDIVCAAISAIIQTAIISITRVCGLKQKVKQKSGYLESVIKVKSFDNLQLNNLLIVLNTMLTGLEEIMNLYPDSITITFGNYNKR